MSNTPTASAEAAGQNIKDSLETFSTSTYPKTVANVATLGGFSSAEELLDAVINRKPGAAMLAAAGLIPSGKLIGKGLGYIAKGTKIASDIVPSAATRAQEIQKVLSPRTQRSVTTAVTETLEGTRVISSSEGRLRPAQRAALRPGEVVGAGKPGTHAEVNGVRAAKEMGLTPTGVAPSRPACAGCQRAMEEEGVSILGPY